MGLNTLGRKSSLHTGVFATFPSHRGRHLQQGLIARTLCLQALDQIRASGGRRRSGPSGILHWRVSHHCSELAKAIYKRAVPPQHVVLTADGLSRADERDEKRSGQGSMLKHFTQMRQCTYNISGPQVVISERYITRQ